MKIIKKFILDFFFFSVTVSVYYVYYDDPNDTSTGNHSIQKKLRYTRQQLENTRITILVAISMFPTIIADTVQKQ